ncbi:hypothetical protein BJF93_22735 [Xaviernesmea oryzae]|uniref:Uncharacterized protein n=1 Tax=Xaviernesmea oryzae TaxID=464029 RepID=A0A1Q9B377_9HYPH|nr:hypothetical protein [Xaviernesmea oryzae]OLP62475.1 hypothetical protein BJF93_22735 [Xaviernesmea oryzae]SEM17692.1 hypothetical protein SAMN04487976_12177 [Xaviernesmea oryzae]
MPGENEKTLYATFDTREAADRAIEHLVQQYGIDRSDVFVEADGADNTAGTAPSGGDMLNREGEGTRTDAALEGKLKVSVDLALDDMEKAQAAFRDAGARDVSSS